MTTPLRYVPTVLLQINNVSADPIAYRRGFIEGADNAVTGVRRKLTEDDLRKIRAWMKALSKWRAPGGQGQEAAPAFPQLDLPLKGDSLP